MTQMTSETGGARVPQWDRADRMRKALRESNETVGSMADYLGVKRGAVSTWINGRVNPSRQTVILWALKTGVAFDWLDEGKVATDIEPDGPSTQGVAGSAWNVRYMRSGPAFTCDDDLSLAVTAA